MRSERPIMRLLRHPAYLPTVGVLLLIYGAVAGNVAALLAAACCLYLAWNIDRQRTPRTDTGADRQFLRYPPGMRRAVEVALVIGLVWGGSQAYWRLVEVGWGRSSAVAGAVVIVGLVGTALWLVVRVLVGRRT